MMVKEQILELALGSEWQEIANVKDPTLISFRKNINGAKARINVWWTTMTVGTSLKHPIKGKTQLFRRNVSDKLMIMIFQNPRVHTDRGYQRKTHV